MVNSKYLIGSCYRMLEPKKRETYTRVIQPLGGRPNGRIAVKPEHVLHSIHNEELKINIKIHIEITSS